MKKKPNMALWVVFASVLLVSMLSSCDNRVNSKVLIVKNDSASAIITVSIGQYISGSKDSAPNALVDGDTIAVGGSQIFYLAPYSKSAIHLYISNGTDSHNISFTYDYEVNGHNEAITATFDEMEIAVDGSNAEPLVV
ncbi:hypothetical protein [uncultured Sphaerochaeta sp.]|uniref:hypothetical protein n=1 Tax=uncultured Sphaerochaeta sp. TaxID=886478 RepID=UPI002A0A7CB8|nr:hypothetical protein [uncultured Sphaerochaeta sp.]